MNATFSNIVGLSLVTIARNFKVFALYLVVSVFFVFLVSLCFAIIMSLTGGLNSSSVLQSFQALSPERMPTSPDVLMMYSFYLFIIYTASFIMSLGGFYLATLLAEGRSPSIFESFGEGFRIFPRAFVAALLFSALWALYMLVPALSYYAILTNNIVFSLVALALCVPFVYILMPLMILLPVCVVEDRGVDAFARCYELVKFRVWRILASLLFLFILSGLFIGGGFFFVSYLFSMVFSAQATMAETILSVVLTVVLAFLVYVYTFALSLSFPASLYVLMKKDDTDEVATHREAVKKENKILLPGQKKRSR